MSKNNKIVYEKNILQTVIDNIPDIIFCKDKEFRYTGINKKCENFHIQRGIESIIGKLDIELDLDKEFIEECIKNDKIVIENKIQISFEEKIQVPNSNEYQILQTIKRPIFDDDGNIQGLVGVVRDINEQKKLEEN